MMVSDKNRLGKKAHGDILRKFTQGQERKQRKSLTLVATFVQLEIRTTSRIQRAG
jgi:hypothetical protein